MEQIDEEGESATFDYVMPLNATSPSPRSRQSIDNEEVVEYDEDLHDYRSSPHRTRGRGSSRWGAEAESTTPRFQNFTSGSGFANPRGEDQMVDGLPSIPFRDHDHDHSPQSLDTSQKQSGSLGFFIAKNNQNSGTVKFNVDHDDVDSLPSLPLNAVFGGPSTPTSNMASSYSKRTPDRFRRSAQQIGMDGAINRLPMSPASTTEESTMHSRVGSEIYPSPKKLRPESHRESALKPTDQMMHGSMFSLTSQATEHYPIDRMRDHDGASSDAESNIFMPITCCGFVLPVWLSAVIRGSPRLERISRCVVNELPCFWCLGNLAPGSSTDRLVLIRLAVLCIIMTSVQVIMAMWLAWMLLIIDNESRALSGFAPHLWNCNGSVFSIGILACILMLTCSCTIRVIKEVDLVAIIRYLWIMFWIVPFEIFFNISMYDYHNVTIVWIRHWWLDDHMTWFRSQFCEAGTATTKCMLPILPNEGFGSEELWCLENYNATDCEMIRDDAQNHMENMMLTFYTGLAGWTSILLFFMLLMVNSLERIITKPIVQKSRETNVPAWLFLPTITNAMVGSVLLFSPSSLLSASSDVDSSWIGIVYLVAAGLFLVALITGWFLSAYTIQNHGDKQTKNVAAILLITIMAATVLLLATIFISSIFFSASLTSTPIDESQRGEVACRVDRNMTCTSCDSSVPKLRCPEWTFDDVTAILKAQLKQSAALASIFILYAVSVLRFGVTLRKHLSLYQIDYV